MMYRVKKEIVKITGFGTMCEKEIALSSNIDYMDFKREPKLNEEYCTKGSYGYEIPDQCYMKVIPLEKIECAAVS